MGINGSAVVVPCVFPLCTLHRSRMIIEGRMNEDDENRWLSNPSILWQKSHRTMDGAKFISMTHNTPYFRMLSGEEGSFQLELCSRNKTFCGGWLQKKSSRMAKRAYFAYWFIGWVFWNGDTEKNHLGLLSSLTSNEPNLFCLNIKLNCLATLDSDWSVRNGVWKFVLCCCVATT